MIGIYIIEPPAENIEVASIPFNNSEQNFQNYEWYDFTISDDANVLWGACRTVGDF